MLRFQLFGIPIEIQPWFWISIAMFGGGLSANTPEGFLQMLIFMLAALVSILVHEFGHALVGRRFAGGYPTVTLWAFGGLATHHGATFTRWSRMMTILAGPGAGLALLTLVILVLLLVLGPQAGLVLTSSALFGGSLIPITPEIVEQLRAIPDRAWSLIHDMLWINFWWSIINMLPVLPLDGGQAAELLVRPRRRMLLLSIATGAAVAAFGLINGRLFLAVLFGFLAWRSFKELRSFRRF